jgi:hypothetical protein
MVSQGWQDLQVEEKAQFQTHKLMINIKIKISEELLSQVLETMARVLLIQSSRKDRMNMNHRVILREPKI